MIGKLSSCLRTEAQQHYVDALYDNPSRILVHNDPSKEPKTTTNTPANSEMHFLTLSQPRRKEPKLDNCAALFSKAYVRRSIAQVTDESAVGKHIRTGPR